jgi:hypothetical protein
VSLKQGARPGTALLALAACFLAGAAPALTPEWQTTVPSTGGETQLRGVCETGGVAYVAAMVSEKIGEPVPILYAIPLGSASTAPVAKTLWKGGRSRTAKDMSNPLCDSAGISFVVREVSKGKSEVVRLGLAGKVLDRKPIAIADFYSADRWISIRKELRVLADNRRLFAVGAEGDSSELPIPGLADEEAILDLCAFRDGSGFVLLTMSLAGPKAHQRVRQFDAKSQMTESRTIPGAFGSVSCGLAQGEVQAVYVDADAGKIVLARFGPKLAPMPTEPIVAASVASMGFTGLAGRDFTFWALNSGMRSQLYQVSGKAAPAIAWAEKDVQRWGTTINPPAVVLVGGGSIVLVMEAIDRSARGAKVLRVVRLGGP